MIYFKNSIKYIISFIIIYNIKKLLSNKISNILNNNKSNSKEVDILLINETKSLINDTKSLVNETKSLVNNTKSLINNTKSLINIKKNFIKRESKNDRIDNIFTNETKSLINESKNDSFQIYTNDKKDYRENIIEKNHFRNNIRKINIEDINYDFKKNNHNIENINIFEEVNNNIDEINNDIEDIDNYIIKVDTNIKNVDNDIEELDNEDIDCNRKDKEKIINIEEVIEINEVINIDGDIDESIIQQIINNDFNDNDEEDTEDRRKKSNYNLKDIYDNFFNYENYKKDKDINIKYDTIDCDDIKNKDLNLKSYSILNDVKNNIKIDRFLTYTFISKKNNYYKIKYKLLTNNISNISNIKLVINDNEKKFIYDYSKYNLFDDIINQYGFTLDFNNFNIDALINIEIYFYNKNNENIIIDNAVIDIVENNILTDNNSLIIFNINGKYNPIYSNISNILDYEDPLENYIDTDDLFFI
jgi:hypothetical protein